MEHIASECHNSNVSHFRSINRQVSNSDFQNVHRQWKNSVSRGDRRPRYGDDGIGEIYCRSSLLCGSRGLKCWFFFQAAPQSAPSGGLLGELGNDLGDLVNDIGEDLQNVNIG